MRGRTKAPRLSTSTGHNGSSSLKLPTSMIPRQAISLSSTRTQRRPIRRLFCHRGPYHGWVALSLLGEMKGDQVIAALYRPRPNSHVFLLSPEQTQKALNCDGDLRLGTAVGYREISVGLRREHASFDLRGHQHGRSRRDGRVYLGQVVKGPYATPNRDPAPEGQTGTCTRCGRGTPHDRRFDAKTVGRCRTHKATPRGFLNAAEP